MKNANGIEDQVSQTHAEQGERTATNRFIAASSLCALAAVGTPVPVAAETVSRVTPFVQLEEGAGAVQIPDNAYSSLVIEATPPAAGAKIIHYAKRNLVFRFTSGKKYTFSTVLTAEAGLLRETVPLFSRHYESSSKVGETFKRDISFDQQNYPHFLASTDSGSRVASFVLKSDMTESTSSEASSTALGFLSTALKAVAPTSTVVTALTKESTQSVADKIDEQASKLFATSVGETLRFDIPLDKAVTYTVTLYGPEVELDELMEKHRGNSIPVMGRWKISLAQPKPSIFLDQKCTRSAERATYNCDWRTAFEQASRSPSTVLSFKLVERVGELGTIKAYLLQQDWWQSSVTALEAKEEGAKPDYGRFCRAIRDSISGLGLNDLDGAIVANAVAQSGLVSTTASDKLRNDSNCKYSPR